MADTPEEIVCPLKASIAIFMLISPAQFAALARPSPEQLASLAPIAGNAAPDFSREVLMTRPQLRPGVSAVQEMRPRSSDTVRPTPQKLQCGLPIQPMAPAELRWPNHLTDRDRKLHFLRPSVRTIPSDLLQTVLIFSQIYVAAKFR